MRSGQLRGVIFDMDGVLVDSHAAHRKAWHLFFETLGREVPEAELDFILDGRKRGEILRHFLGKRPDAEVEEFGRRKDCIFRQTQLEVAAVPGAIPLVRELHANDTALGLATSASRSRALSTLTELGVLHCFRVVVTGEDVALGKPDAGVYRLACQRLEIENKYLIAVEDAVSGVRAAVAAGLRCIGVALHETAENLRAVGAIHVVPNFESVSAKDLEGMVLDYESGVQLSPRAAAIENG
jgi:HAD superfamily hydrolase (TIGR01509 family)